MNIFERAVRSKLRFMTSIGVLSSEDLFDLPLLLPNGRACLDKVARETNLSLRAYGEDSFVEEKPAAAKIELQLKLDIIKHVIASKQADAAAAETRVKNEARRQKLLEVLAKKQDASLEGMDEADILKELEALNV